MILTEYWTLRYLFYNILPGKVVSVNIVYVSDGGVKQAARDNRISFAFSIRTPVLRDALLLSVSNLGQ